MEYAAFSPDGTQVVTASMDGTARVWLVRWKELVTYLRNSTTVCLSTVHRKHFLGESTSDAQKAYEACERRYGRVP